MECGEPADTLEDLFLSGRSGYLKGIAFKSSGINDAQRSFSKQVDYLLVKLVYDVSQPAKGASDLDMVRVFESAHCWCVYRGFIGRWHINLDKFNGVSWLKNQKLTELCFWHCLKLQLYLIIGVYRVIFNVVYITERILMTANIIS
jgi:hypothetical protein